MAKKIDTIEKYKALFNDASYEKNVSGKEDKDVAVRSLGNQKIELALSYALEIRKFEIDLYWRRTAYFWTLITVAFAGYFSLSVGDGTSLNAFIIACLGFILSVAWYLVNRGSKFWQENWEMHVDSLENDCIGPLYKTTKSKEGLSFFMLHEGYPFSVSKVNQLVSLFAVFAWLVLIMKVVPSDNVEFLSWFYENPRKTVLTATLIGVGGMTWLSNGKKSNWRRHVDFDSTELKNRKLKEYKLKNRVKKIFSFLESSGKGKG